MKMFLIFSHYPFNIGSSYNDSLFFISQTDNFLSLHITLSMCTCACGHVCPLTNLHLGVSVVLIFPKTNLDFLNFLYFMCYPLYYFCSHLYHFFHFMYLTVIYFFQIKRKSDFKSFFFSNKSTSSYKFSSTAVEAASPKFSYVVVSFLVSSNLLKFFLWFLFWLMCLEE